MHRLKSFTTLSGSLIMASVLLLTILCSGLFLFMQNANRTSLMDGALKQQITSLRVLTSTFEDRFDTLSVTYGADGLVRRADWAAIPDMADHDLIDRVGQISGETATVFAWDPAENDFLRQTTNIIKPDGQRAVGTYLGRTNPVYAAMLRGETFRGEATILW